MELSRKEEILHYCSLFFQKDWVKCGNQYLLDSNSHPLIFSVTIMHNIDFHINIQLLWTLTA